MQMVKRINLLEPTIEKYFLCISDWGSNFLNVTQESNHQKKKYGQFGHH